MDYVLKINSNIVINLEQNISEKDEVYDSIVQSSLNNIEIEIYKDKDIHIEEIILNVGGEIFLPDSVTENIIENPLKILEKKDFLRVFGDIAELVLKL